MSAENYFEHNSMAGPHGPLTDSGINANVQQEATGIARQQLEANSLEERNQVRANATATGRMYGMWDTLDDAVMGPLLADLVLDQAFAGAGLTHDLRWWETESIWGIRGRMGPAEHTTDLRTRSEGGRIPQGNEGIAIPYSIKDYTIPEKALARSQATGQSIEASDANGAGRRVAELIEDTYLYGSQIQLTTFEGFQLGCPGFLNVSGRTQLTAGGSWADGNVARTDINRALNAFSNQYRTSGSNWLVIGNEQNNQFEEDYYPGQAGRDVSTRSRIEGLSRLDRVLHVPRMPDGEAFIMKADTREFDAARLPDGPLNLEWDTHGGMSHEYKVYHLAAPRIKHRVDGSCGVVHLAGLS